MYEGKLLETVLTCQYNVERNFTATKNSTSSGIKPVTATRSNSGKVKR